MTTRFNCFTKMATERSMRHNFASHFRRNRDEHNLKHNLMIIYELALNFLKVLALDHI